MARKHDVTLEEEPQAVRPVPVSPPPVPPRTKAEAEAQIRAFVKSHKPSLDALARL